MSALAGKSRDSGEAVFPIRPGDRHDAGGFVEVKFKPVSGKGRFDHFAIDKRMLRTIAGIAEINESGGYEKQFVIL